MILFQLREIQRSFAGAVLTGDFEGLGRYVREDGMRKASRIGIYRNNVVTSLTSLLAERFPLTERLVDARFFAFAAERFIADLPPDQPCLDLYGAALAGFLAEFPACADLPYLSDVARLEWKLFCVARAAAPPPIGIESLQRIGADQAMSLRFECDPAVDYLMSPWPVRQIWQTHQEIADPEPVALNSGVNRIEIRRIGGHLLIRELEPAEFAFRSVLAAGAMLVTAIELAIDQLPEFEFSQSLAGLFRDQWVTGYGSADFSTGEVT